MAFPARSAEATVVHRMQVPRCLFAGIRMFGLPFSVKDPCRRPLRNEAECLLNGPFCYIMAAVSLLSQAEFVLYLFPSVFSLTGCVFLYWLCLPDRDSVKNTCVLLLSFRSPKSLILDIPIPPSKWPKRTESTCCLYRHGSSSFAFSNWSSP